MSFFADLLGGLAQSGEKVLGDRIDQQQKLDLQQQQSDLAVARDRTAAQLRQQMEEEARQSKMKRTSDQMGQAEAQGKIIGQERELSTAQRLAPSLDKDSLGVVKSTLTPEQIEKFYGIKNNPLAGYDDQLMAARRGGLYDAEAELKAARDETAKALKLEYDRRHQERRDDASDDRNAALIANNQNTVAGMLKATEIRTSAKGGKGGSGEKTGNTVFDRTVKLLEDSGASPEEIKSFVTHAKGKSEDDLAYDIWKTSKTNGDNISQEEARAMAKTFKTAPVAAPANPATAGKPGTPGKPTNTAGWSIVKKIEPKK